MIRVDCATEDREQLQRLADEAFKQLALTGNAYVEVDFVNEEEIREINATYRGVDRATDVLSFPALNEIMDFTKENYPYECNDEGEVMLGSIIVCKSVARRQAEEYGHSEKRENCYLFTHGLMHLLGYDHEEDSDKILMREAEEKTLTALGINRED